MGGHHSLLQKAAIRLFEVCLQSASVERECKAEGVIHTEMRSSLSNVTVQMLLYLYVNLRFLNKLTSEMGDFFTDDMRDSNSHEFEEIVHPITCIPNDSWSLSHLGYLYPGTTPVMFKLDHDKSCPWVQIAQVTKARTIITKVIVEP